MEISELGGAFEMMHGYLVCLTNPCEYVPCSDHFMINIRRIFTGKRIFSRFFFSLWKFLYSNVTLLIDEHSAEQWCRQTVSSSFPSLSSMSRKNKCFQNVGVFALAKSGLGLCGPAHQSIHGQIVYRPWMGCV